MPPAYPFGGGKRAIVVRDLSAFHPDYQEAIAQVAERLASDEDAASILIVVAPGLDRRKRPYRILDGLERLPAGAVLHFEAPKPWKMDGWVSTRAREREIRLRPGAARALVDLVGDDLMVLEGELTKLELFAGRGKDVDVAAVEAVVGRRRGETPWDLPRLLLAGQGGEAERLAARLLSSGEKAVFLLNVMTRQVIESYRVRLLLDAGADRDTIIREVGIKQFAADDALRTARQVQADRFPRMLEILKGYDLKLKSVSGQNQALFQGLLGEIAHEANGGRN